MCHLQFGNACGFSMMGRQPIFHLLFEVTLNEIFEEHWLGRDGPVAWPARSPDLTPLDFSLWGQIKSLVYETPVESVEDLIARITAAAEYIQTMPGIFHKVNHCKFSKPATFR
jgi:hypothetical protein